MSELGWFEREVSIGYQGFEQLGDSILGDLGLLCGLVALFNWRYLSGIFWTNRDLSLESLFNPINREFYVYVLLVLIFWYSGLIFVNTNPFVL